MMVPFFKGFTYYIGLQHYMWHSDSVFLKPKYLYESFGDTFKMQTVGVSVVALGLNHSLGSLYPISENWFKF